MMPLPTSTVTQIVRVNEDVFPPALAELSTSDGETFPIFDADILIAAKIAEDTTCAVLLRLQHSSGARRGYVRDIYAIDVSANVFPCPDCATSDRWNAKRGVEMKHDYSLLMTRESASAANGGVDQFACDRCGRRIYLAPVEPEHVQLPCIARARVNRLTDGIFALDHVKRHAILTDTCDASVSHMPPWNGIHAELEPFSETFVLDGLDMTPYRRKRQPHEPLKAMQPELKLRLHERPFDGRVVYEVI